MTVPPNYGPPPDQPQTPGYGYQSPYNGGQSPYGSQPQQPQQPPYGGGPQYGGQPPYEPPTGPYGAPVPPPEPPKRNLGLIGGIVIGAVVLVLGATLLVVLNMRGDDDQADGGDGTTSEEASDGETSPQEETTTQEETDTEVGQCLPYAPVIEGDGLALLDCADPAAFWTITAQSYDVDGEVDAEGNLVDSQVAYDLCGAGWGQVYPGNAWQTWHTVYSSGVLDSLYCYEAIGAANPDNPEQTPIIPDTGDCFDDSDSWWTVDCGSGSAIYRVDSTVVYDNPVPMTEDELNTAGTECGTDWYFSILDFEDNVLALLCANDV
ncbi:hypothetical protein [Glycomyces harbinensis]|nr:hypothetical protein [Glycomyces harbinensis]